MLAQSARQWSLKPDDSPSGLIPGLGLFRVSVLSRRTFSRFSMRHLEDVNIVVTRGCRSNEVSHGLLSLQQQQMGAKTAKKAVGLLLHFKTCEKRAGDGVSSSLHLPKSKVPMIPGSCS